MEVGRIVGPLERVPSRPIACRAQSAGEIDSQNGKRPGDIDLSEAWCRRRQVRACGELLRLAARVRSTESCAFATHCRATSFRATRERKPDEIVGNGRDGCCEGTDDSDHPDEDHALIVPPAHSQVNIS